MQRFRAGDRFQHAASTCNLGHNRFHAEAGFEIARCGYSTIQTWRHRHVICADSHMRHRHALWDTPHCTTKWGLTVLGATIQPSDIVYPVFDWTGTACLMRETDYINGCTRHMTLLAAEHSFRAWTARTRSGRPTLPTDPFWMQLALRKNPLNDPCVLLKPTQGTQSLTLRST